MNYRTKKTVVRHGVDQSRNAVPKLTSSTIHQMESSSDESTQNRLGNWMEGAAWMTTFKIVDRCTAVLSTSILARLLVQEDFGFVALATSMIAVLQVFGRIRRSTVQCFQATLSLKGTPRGCGKGSYGHFYFTVDYPARWHWVMPLGGTDCSLNLG